MLARSCCGRGTKWAYRGGGGYDGSGEGGAKTREYDIIGNISSTCDDACVYFVKKYRWIFVIFKAGISPHYIDVSTMYVL